MNTNQAQQQIWFVYDGDCPLCKHAALALKIKQSYGRLYLVNAREESNHPVMVEINTLGLDLDEGMIIYDGNRFYHGKQALSFMAKFGDSRGVFNLINKALFWSSSIANITYPWLRGVRNYLLLRNHIPQIDNLNRQSAPIFESIFGEHWQQLPVVLQKHYRNRPYTNDAYLVKGKLDVFCAGPIQWLAPLLWRFGGIPPITEYDVPVTVEFLSNQHSKAFIFNRTFFFKHRKPYRFLSSMVPLKDNIVVEMMRFGIGWKTSFHWEDGRVKLKHQGYVLKILGHYVSMPLTAIIGAGNATETALDERTFEMQMDITHPWWGKVYGYKGRFEICN